MATLSSERSLQECKRLGLTAGKVERFVQQAGRFGRRFDLWGWVDIMAIADEYVIAIQSCSMSGRSAHLKKIEGDEKVLAALHRWVAVPGCRAELWAWRKLKKGKRMLWTVDRMDLGEYFPSS